MGCSSRHSLSTFNFQMALARKNVFLDSLFPSLSPSLLLSYPASLLWLTSGFGLFQVQNAQCEVRGKVVRQPGRQTGT